MTQQGRALAKVCIALISYPLAVRYKARPSKVYQTLDAITKLESGYDFDIKNPDPDSSATGLFQFVKGTSEFEQYWIGAPWYRSIPLQAVEMLREHLKSGDLDESKLSLPEIIGTYHNQGHGADSVEVDYVVQVVKRMEPAPIILDIAPPGLVAAAIIARL